MATVYRNATVTLAAEWASSSDEGCFPPDGGDGPRGGPKIKSLAFHDPATGSTHRVFARAMAAPDPAPTLDSV
jgi:hypothetical protein